MIDAVRDEQVLVTVVVQVGEQGRPAPIGRIHAGQIPDFAEALIATIELQCVAGVLRPISGGELQVVDVEALGIGGRFEDALLLGQHVEDHHVRPAVVVEIGRVHAHRGVTRVPHGRRDGFGERAVAVVVVEEVVFLKVVGDVQVRAAVPVQVAGDDAQPVPHHAAEDVRLAAHVHEMAAVVAVETVSDARRACARQEARAGRASGARRVGQQVHVQIAVSVVVEEEGLGGKAGEVEAVLLRPVRERPVAVVDVEHVVAVHREEVDAGDVDVHPAVPVDVRHRDSGLPAVGIGDAGPRGDIFEPIVPLVQIEAVGPHVRREIQVRQTVVVDVAHGYAAAVVEVHVVEDVERGVVGQPVRERDTGPLGRQELEELGLAGTTAASG